MEFLHEIKEWITTLGFPIFCVVVMWRKITDSDEKQTAVLMQLTSAIASLTEYIKGGVDK